MNVSLWLSFFAFRGKYRKYTNRGCLRQRHRLGQWSVTRDSKALRPHGNYFYLLNSFMLDEAQSRAAMTEHWMWHIFIFA